MTKSTDAGVLLTKLSNNLTEHDHLFRGFSRTLFRSLSELFSEASLELFSEASPEAFSKLIN
jgi:hypothetical protein